MSEPTKAVLSKRDSVEPTKEAWAKELIYRADYMNTTVIEQAIDEILRLHKILIELTKPKDETP